MSSKQIKFMVTLDYENKSDGPICTDSMLDNLHDTLKEKMLNDELTPTSVTVENLLIEVEYESELEANS